MIVRVAIARKRRNVPLSLGFWIDCSCLDPLIHRSENAMGDAFDEIVNRKGGLPLPMSDWLNDAEVRKPKAGHAYVRGNCGLIR
jgi:hypothetical protein